MSEVRASLWPLGWVVPAVHLDSEGFHASMPSVLDEYYRSLSQLYEHAIEKLTAELGGSYEDGGPVCALRSCQQGASHGCELLDSQGRPLGFVRIDENDTGFGKSVGLSMGRGGWGA